MFQDRVNKEICIDCCVCTSICPTGAIFPDLSVVESSKCLFCLGCINNCPVEAVEMEYYGKLVYGFKKFKEIHDLKEKIISPFL